MPPKAKETKHKEHRDRRWWPYEKKDAVVSSLRIILGFQVLRCKAEKLNRQERWHLKYLVKRRRDADWVFLLSVSLFGYI